MANKNLEVPLALDVEQSQKRAQKFYILYLIARALRTPTYPDTGFDKQSSFGNILVAHAVFI